MFHVYYIYYYYYYYADAKRQLPLKAVHANSHRTRQNTYSSTTKMEAAGSLETLIPMFHTTRRQIPDECNDSLHQSLQADTEAVSYD
jgi:hypothetical protein